MVIKHPTANAFLNTSQSLLEEKEAENNLLLGLSQTLSKDRFYYSNQLPLFLTVHMNKGCVGAALQTPPYNLVIYASEAYQDSIVKDLCDYLFHENIDLPGIIGPRKTAMKFVKQWSSIKSLSSTLGMDQLIYKLEKLNAVPLVEGNFRKANFKDLKTTSEWVKHFRSEALDQPLTIKDATDLASKKIREGSFYLWETNEPVSMAGWTRSTSNGTTIAWVYTPVKHRKKGYATSCVARLSELMLRKYKFCSLFTDANNPSSNKIYQAIGYKLIDHVLQYKFE